MPMLTLSAIGTRDFSAYFSQQSDDDSVPITLMSKAALTDWKGTQPDETANWLDAQQFTGAAGQIATLPGTGGKIGSVIFGLGSSPTTYTTTKPYFLGAASKQLPPGNFHLTPAVSEKIDGLQACLAWAAGAYSFDAFRRGNTAPKTAKLALPAGVDPHELQRLVEAVFLVRDLVNTPANHMGPVALETACREVADKHRAKLTCTVGDDLLRQNFPLIHTVGRAAAEAPRLVEFTWGDPSDPRVSLVGKGVCFDSGGLNLKPGNSMSLMKKDMGGAAHVLGLAHLIMSAQLPVQLQVLVPIVENAISASAFRPGDVIKGRNGDTVEIGNTDAEGRLILADALAYASEQEPEAIIDMATLTGAARVALGPDLPPFYSDNDDFAAALQASSQRVRDPLWRMPLWPGYSAWLDSKVADVNHIADAPMAGSITAALFLKRFVSNTALWAHFDVYAWNLKPKPGQPVGGEAQAIRALFDYLQARFK